MLVNLDLHIPAILAKYTLMNVDSRNAGVGRRVQILLISWLCSVALLEVGLLLSYVPRPLILLSGCLGILLGLHFVLYSRQLAGLYKEQFDPHGAGSFYRKAIYSPAAYALRGVGLLLFGGALLLASYAMAYAP